MGAGLQQQNIPIFVEGGLNTKLDPRLVPAGSLVELENMYQLKTGELRLRNGFAALSGFNYAEVAGMWPDQFGNIMKVSGAIGFRSFTQFMKRTAGTYGSGSGYAGWSGAELMQTSPYPGVTCERLSGNAGKIHLFSTGSQSSPSCGDVCSDGTYDLHVCIDPGTSTYSPGIYTTRQVSGNEVVEQNYVSVAGAGADRPVVAVAGGTSYTCAVAVDIGGAQSIEIARFATGRWVGASTLVAGTVDAAAPWIDSKSVPGANTIVVAYKRGAGGVGVFIYDPVSAAITVGPVTIAGADASQCLGFLDDQLATGNCYLVTAGAASGIVCRTLSLTTLAVGATDVIDASATTLVRQVTGHTNLSATDYYVFWDLNQATAYYSSIKRGDCVAGVTAVTTHSPGTCLYSRSFKATDGRYYLVGSYDSATQPTLLVMHAYPAPYPGTDPVVPLCLIFPGSSKGRREYPSSLTSAYTDASGRVIISAGRKPSLATATQERLALTFGGMIQARELGGDMLLSGGMIMSYDGSVIRSATTPFYLEPIAAVSSATVGSMTSLATYSYVGVIVENTGKGNRIRSAKSVPVSVTIAVGQTSAALTIQNPRIPAMYGATQIVEIYRAGPAAAGAAAYNKVGEVYSSPGPGGNTLSFTDTMSDIAAGAGELLYSSGNVLENFTTPTAKILEVNDRRAWIVNAEDPTELWPSKECKAGTGVNFNPSLAFKVTGDGAGSITALASMDGRLIVFKSSAIYVVSGDGPNDNGQGSFNVPQSVSRTIGTVLPGSVVSTPDGIMFQSKSGIYLLDRGLGLSYIGAPVERYTLAANVVDSSLVDGVTQVRFVMASGRCLVWDYHHKRWSTFLLRVSGSTIVACANVPSGWCYALASGAILQETPGVYSDVNGTSTAIVPRIGFPALSMGGINGYARLYGVEILGEYVGAHTLAVDFEYNYSGAVTETRAKVITGGPAFQYEALSATQKASSVKITLRTSALAAGSGAFRLSGLTLMVGVKRGSGIANTKRLT